MGFRLSKSIKVAPGVRVRVSTKSVGLSAGTKGLRVSTNSRTGSRATASLPGTGMSWSVPLSKRKSTKRRAPARRTPSIPRLAPREATPAAEPPKPGLLAPKWERRLFTAVASGDTGRFSTIADLAQEARRPCMLFDAFSNESDERAAQLLGFLWQNGYRPEGDAFVQKYFADSTATVVLTDIISAELPLSRDAIGLMYAELLQAQDRLSEAIDVVEQLEPSTFAAISLADLYAADERWADIVSLTDGLKNDDDFATYLLLQRGAALREQGFNDASRQALKAALAPRRRNESLRHLALIERAKTYAAEGKRSAARKDLEKVLSEDASYPSLRELLEDL